MSVARQFPFHQAITIVKNMLLAILLVAALVSGCSTLAPERTAAESLMGKNISEGIKQFGPPATVSKVTFVARSDKLYGQTSYLFIRSGASYNKQVYLGNEGGVTMSDGNTLGSTAVYRTEHVQEGCQVLLVADRNNIIDYYEVTGNCGWNDMGFGNTGALHRLGVN